MFLTFGTPLRGELDMFLVFNLLRSCIMAKFKGCYIFILGLMVGVGGLDGWKRGFFLSL